MATKSNVVFYFFRTLYVEDIDPLGHETTIFHSETLTENNCRSNDVFATFKQEMNKMSKTIKKLEKENTSWKGKHEQVSKSMFTMAEEVGAISNIFLFSFRSGRFY